MSELVIDNLKQNQSFVQYLLTLWSKWLACLLLVLSAASFLFFSLGARINYTQSYPIGLYWTIDKSPQKGDLVHFCPQDNALFQEARKRQYIAYGYCEGGYAELMKRVVAVEGDLITVTPQFVKVNGSKIPNTSNMGTDRFDRKMVGYTANNYTLKKGEVLFISEYNEKSFDGRYFGVQNISQVQDVVTPILTK